MFLAFLGFSMFYAGFLAGDYQNSPHIEEGILELIRGKRKNG